MKLTKTKRDHLVGFNMTPMIDIVFLLIIFFLTVSQITRVVDQPMTLPTVETTVKERNDANVTINMVADGKIVVAGKSYSPDRTIQILKNRLSQYGGDASRIKIELRCDKQCPSEHVNLIIKRLSNLGFQYVFIAVTNEGQSE